MTLPAAHWIAQLASEGYCVIPDLIDRDMVAALDRDLDPHFSAQPFSRGGFYGERTKRFGALLRRSGHAEAILRNPLVLQVVDAMLGPWCDRIALNLTQAIEIHPGAPAQYPHRDQDMWGGPKGEVEYLVNVMWPLVPFDARNGGTRLWAASHRRQAEPILPEREAEVPEIAPGAALLFLGSTLHGGGSNRTALPRRGIIVSYCLGWLKPFENQWLVYPPAIARDFDPELAALVGYAQHRPNLGNVEGQCPSRLLSDDLADIMPATDALLPGQDAALADWMRGQATDRGS